LAALIIDAIGTEKGWGMHNTGPFQLTAAVGATGEAAMVPNENIFVKKNLFGEVFWVIVLSS